MNKDNILKNCHNSKVLELVLKMDTFTMEDYELLVQNRKMSTAEYILPLLKYKFGIEPQLILIKKASYMWRNVIIQNIKIDFNNIGDYINILNDNELKDCFNTGGSVINDNSFFNILFQAGYRQTTKIIMTNYMCNVDEDFLHTMKEYIFNNNIDWNLCFVSKEIMYDFIKHYKYINKKIFNNNSHLLSSSEDLTELYDFLVKNEINSIDIDKKLIKGKNEKEILKLYLLDKTHSFQDLGEKINKYPDLWKSLDFFTHGRSWGRTCDYFNNLMPENKIEDNINQLLDNIIKANTYHFDFNVKKPYDFIPVLYIKINLDQLKKGDIEKLNLKLNIPLINNSNRYIIRRNECIKFISQMFQNRLKEIVSTVQTSIKSELPILNDS